MKKILSIAVLTGLSFFALSCAKETAKSGEGETQVSVSVSLPGIVTKSFADGETAKNLNYVVYLNEPGSSSKDGSIIISGTTSINLTANVEFPLSIGKNYDFVFWADSGEESPYTFDASAKKVTVNYAANNSCSDKGDAFYGHVNKTIVAGDKITCDLIRPFAQVNVGTNDLNAAAVVNSYDKLKATIKVNTYSEFDLMEGKPTGDQAEQSFVASVPASGETFPVTDYKYLAMAYVLVDPEGETQTVTYCVYDEIGGSDEEKIAEPVLNVPLKKNYRTNIYGQLLTSTVAATVTISPAPIGEDINREISTIKYDNTKTAAENGKALWSTIMNGPDASIYYLEDGVYEGSDGQYSRFNGKSFTLIGLGDNVIILGPKYGIVLQDDTTPNSSMVVNLKNLTIKTEHSWAAAVYAKYNIIANLEDIKLECNGGAAILLDNANNYNDGQYYEREDNFGTTVNAKNVTVQSGKGVEFAALPCSSTNTELKTYTYFNHESSNFYYLKPQSISTGTGNHYVNGSVLNETAGQGVTLITTVAQAQSEMNAGATEVSVDIVEGDAEFIIPKVFSATDEVTVNIPATGDYIFTFSEAAGGEGNLPAALNIVTPDSQANNLVINCPSLTVTVNGALQNVTSTTAANTLIVPEDCVIENLEVLKGNVKIYGTVNNITLAQNCKISHLSVRTAKQLRSIAPICEKISYVELLADIDLGNEVWTPIGPNADASQKFQGTFEGNNHTISNLKVEQGDSYHAAGFFGSLNGIARNFTIDGANIKSISGGAVTDNGNSVVAGSIYPSGTIDNVHVKNAKIEANRYIGGIAGYTYGNVTNCTVENLEIIATPNQVNGAYDNGDKVGGISGYFSDDYGRNILSGNTATKVKITAVRDAGGIVGAANADYLSKNTADNITLIRDNSLLSTETRVRMDGVLGYILGGDLAASNTATNVTFTANALPGQLGSIMAGTTTPNTTILLQEGAYTFDCGTTRQVKQTFSGWGDQYVSDEHEGIDAIEYTNIKDNFEIKIIGAGKDKSAILWSDGTSSIQAGGAISLLVNKANITFQDMLLVRRYHSILDAKVETYNNCEIWGNHSSRSETVNYNNCYFNTLAKTSTISGINNFPSGCNQAILFGGYSHYINFDNCEFHTNQNKAVQIYSSMRNNLLQDITAKNCTLYGGADKQSNNRGFFEVHGECGIHGTLTLTNCKINSGDEGNWPGGVWTSDGYNDSENYYKIIVDDETKKESTWDSTHPQNVWTGNYTIQ